MFGFFKRRYRDWFYCDELNNILDEEEKLINEWIERFSKPTSRTFTLNPEAAWEAQHRQVEAVELRQIWEELCQLHRESRKLEEIRKIIDKEEKTLPPEEIRTIRQLKRKLRWKPITLKMSLDHKLEGRIADGLTRERLQDREYSERLGQITNDEIKFWEHLSYERERIQKIIDKYKGDNEESKIQFEKVISMIDSNDLHYTDLVMELVVELREMLSAKRAATAEWKENMKPTFRGACNRVVNHINEVLTFLKRAEELSDDVKRRLRAIRPS